jgi:O-antigen/teichoic acid export membrane protein
LFNYSFVNYIANIFNIAPTLILPLIVLNHLGAANAGYYYLAFTIANLLYAVVYAVSSSLFAEGSYAEESLKDLVTKSTKIVAILIIPSTIILIIFGPTVLKIFGETYSDSARDIIRILALSSPAVAAYTLGNIILRIFHKVEAIITVNLIYMVSISVLAYMWVDYGLYAVGYAWMAGNIIASIYAFKSIYNSRHHLV